MTTSVKSLDAIKHSTSAREKRDLVNFVNAALGDTNINPTTDEIFEKITDGVILCRLVALIDPNALARPPTTRFSGVNQFFTKLENLKLALDGAKKLGCNIVNVDPQDLSSGTPTLVLGLLAQIVRILLMSSVRALANQPDEAAEDSLLRWFNYHLKAAHVSDTVTSFGELQDCRLLAILLHQLEPSKCDSLEAIMSIYDDDQRAEALLKNAEKIDCAKFISAQDIVRGNAQRLIPFLATIFLKYPKVTWDEVAMIKRRSGVFRSPSRFPNRNSMMMSSPILATPPRTTPQVTPVKLEQNFDSVSDEKTNGHEHSLPSPKASPVTAKVNTNQTNNKTPNGKHIEEKVVIKSDPDLLQPNNTNQMNGDSNPGSLQNTPRLPLAPPSNVSSSIALNVQNFPRVNGTPKMTPSHSTNSFYPESNRDSIESLKNDILLLRSERNTLQIDLSTLRTETEAADKAQKADIKRLRDLVKKLEDDKLIMAQKIDSLEMDLLRKKRENELRAKETEQLTEQLHALKQSGEMNQANGNMLNQSVDTEGQDFLAKLRQAEEEYKALESELEALNKENKELYREREEMTQELASAKSDVARHKSKSESLEKLIASLQRDQSLSRQGSNVSIINPDDLKLENDELKKSVDECFAKIAELEARENSLKKDLAVATETTRQKMKEQETHLLQMFEARERDLKVHKDNQISELQAKIKQIQNNVEKGPEVDRLLSTAKIKFDSKEQELRRQFMQEMAQRDKLLRDKAEKVKALSKELAKAKKKEKRIEQFLSPPDEYEGWLFEAKKSKVQRRWCVLRGETLFIYNDRKVKNWVKTAGALYIPNSVLKSLDEAELKKTNRKYKYGFSIGSKYASHTYIFLTETEDMRQDWVQSIETSKRYYESKAVLTGDISDATSVEDSVALPPPVMFFADDKKSQKSSSKSSSTEKKSMQQPISSSSSSSASNSSSRSSSTVSSAKLQPEVIAEIMQMNSNSIFHDNNGSNNNVNINNGSDDESLDSPVSRSESE